MGEVQSSSGKSHRSEATCVPTPGLSGLPQEGTGISPAVGQRGEILIFILIQVRHVTAKVFYVCKILNSILWHPVGENSKALSGLAVTLPC